MASKDLVMSESQGGPIWRAIRKIEIIPPAPPGSSLGVQVETTIARAIQRLLNSSVEFVVNLGSGLIGFALEIAERALIGSNRAMVEMLKGMLPEDSPVRPYLDDMLSGESQAGFFSLSGFASTMGSSAAGNLLGILLRPAGYELDSRLHTARLDPGAAVNALWREEISPTDFSDQLQDLGWSPDVIRIWQAILRPVLEERDTLTLFLRGHIGLPEARSRLYQRGYDDVTIDAMIQVLRPLVGSGDLQGLLHRETIGPTEFRERLGKQGYTEDQTRELESLAWNLLSPGDLLELHRRGEIEPATLEARLKDHGYTQELVTEIVEVGRPLTGITELTSLAWREELAPEAFRERLEQHGYTLEQIAEIEILIHRIPGPGDLISMAVREAFRPDLIAEYGYLSEYPPEFGEWMAKQGFDEEWSQKYWVAHWTLPSLTMAYRMFHRRIIGEQDLERLFAISDIAPFWRPKLLEAAYQPLTRVDVRRMFQLGVLERQDVYDSYLDLGYSPENAENMTVFTERYSMESDREATKADILRAYAAGIISRDDARDELVGINYQEEWAEFYLLMEDWKRAEALLKQETDLLEDQYIEGLISRADVHTQLGKWNLPATQIETYLELWDITKARKVSVPSVGQLENFLKGEILTEGAYRELMTRRHYPPETVEWFLQEIRVQIVQEALDAEEKARAQEERAARGELRTGYDVDKATMDLQIAQLKTALAENKVLIGTLIDYDLVEQLIIQNEQIALAIIHLKEDKARGKLTYTSELAGMEA